MTALNEVLARAVAAGDLPFAVGMTGTADGITWAGAAGESHPGRAAGPDTVFRIFSMTKAIGSTAAMILIDRGALSPDTPVEEILPEWKDIRLLDGWDGDTPRMRAPAVKATVRHLSTHTSGLCYEFWNPDVPRWMQATGHPTILAGTKAAMAYPLVFEPGTRWDYGIGIDWLGLVVERVSGKRIDAFCREEIFGPLGMTDTTFEPTADQIPRLAQAKIRGADGRFADHGIAPPPNPEVYGMGHCLYSTAPDYMRFLRMYLGRGALEGTRILSAATVERMLGNQIGALRVGRLTSLVPPLSADAEHFPGREKTHSFAFVRLEEDVPGMRTAGSQTWAGVLNTHYWFDPAKDLAAVIMTQSLPFAEPRFMATYEAFERAAYAA